MTSNELFFVEHNSSASETVVLLHGLFGSHLQWEYVVPHLSDYHLLVPDMPQHSASRAIAPFSLGLAADEIAKMIKSHAHGGKAHVVGLSLGGYTTQELIRRYPELVMSALSTGATPYPKSVRQFLSRSGVIHWGLWFMQVSGLYGLDARRMGLKPHAQEQKEIWENNKTVDLTRDGFADLIKWNWDDVKDVGTKNRRILVCAGAAQDDVESTKQVATLIMETAEQRGDTEGSQTKGVAVKGGMHGWNLQLPELFAQGIRAWIKDEDLPSEFEPLQ